MEVLQSRCNTTNVSMYLTCMYVHITYVYNYIIYERDYQAHSCVVKLL